MKKLLKKLLIDDAKLSVYAIEVRSMLVNNTVTRV